jgi:transcriptional regulator with XRE-family HTH domain
MRTRTDGEAIRQLREEQGLSNLALAERAGISPTYMSRLENEVRQGSHEARSRIAAALGVPLSQISKPVPYVPAQKRAA